MNAYRRHLFLSLGVILLVVSCLGTFLYGFQMGANRIKMQLKQKQTSSNSQDPIAHQELIVYYSSVLSPFQEFLSGWFKQLESEKPDMSLLLKQSKQKYAQLTLVPITSLKESQMNLLRSLKLFETGLDEYIKKNKNLNKIAMKNSTYFNEAMQYYLRSQHEYLQAMLKWGNLKNISPSDDLSYEVWNQYSLLSKITFISAWMYDAHIFENFHPQDLVAKIDHMLRGEHVSQLEIHSIQKLSKFLVDSEAVDIYDFKKLKQSLYKNEKLPLISWFQST